VAGIAARYTRLASQRKRPDGAHVVGHHARHRARTPRTARPLRAHVATTSGTAARGRRCPLQIVRRPGSGRRAAQPGRRSTARFRVASHAPRGQFLRPLRQVRESGHPPALVLRLHLVESVNGQVRSRILVVDDEPAIATLLADVLTGDGHDVDVAPNGRIALERVRARAYDLILSDIEMPGLDGIALYEELALVAPALRRRILFVTGTVDRPRVASFLAETRVPVLEKPVPLAELRRRVRALLAARAG
jgi:CheY-like chemotaxis protein